MVNRTNQPIYSQTTRVQSHLQRTLYLTLERNTLIYVTTSFVRQFRTGLFGSNISPRLRRQLTASQRLWDARSMRNAPLAWGCHDAGRQWEFIHSFIHYCLEI